MRPRAGVHLIRTLLLVLAAALSSSAPALAGEAALLDEPGTLVEALDFTAQTLDGRTVQLSKLRGQVVFLNFWATWCAPCRAEMPAMERVHRTLQGQPFRMLAVNLQEQPGTIRKFVAELGLTFDIVLDPDAGITTGYNVNNLPLTYLIDKRGRIVARALGERPWDKSAYLDVLRRLLSE